MECIIFDFDGTIANTRPIMFNIYSNLSQQFNLKKITLKEIEFLRKKEPREIIN